VGIPWIPALRAERLSLLILRSAERASRRMQARLVASPFETAAAQPPQGEERDRRIAFLGTTSGDSRSHSRDTIFARALQIHRPSPKRGRRESRALTAPAAPRAMVVKNAHGFDRYSRDIPAFPAQWLYDLLRALPGERRFLSPLSAGYLPQNRRHGRGARTTRLRRTLRTFSSGEQARLTPQRPSHLTARLVTIAIRPFAG